MKIIRDPKRYSCNECKKHYDTPYNDVVEIVVGNFTIALCPECFKKLEDMLHQELLYNWEDEN